MAVFSQTRQFYKKFAFTVEIQGVVYAGFRACSALKVSIAKIEHWEGGSIAPHQAPGRVTTTDVTLSRGATDDLDLWNWLKQTIDASAMLDDPDIYRSIDVVQRDRRQEEKRRWTLAYCFPTGFTAGEWDNNADENTIEEIVLAVRYPNLGGDNPA